MTDANVRRGLRFRELVALSLAADGHEDAKPRTASLKLSESFTAGVEQGDVVGLPDWTLVVRNELTRDLSGALDEAEQRSEIADTPYFGVVWSRPRRMVDQSYVILPLAELSRIMLRLRGL